MTTLLNKETVQQDLGKFPSTFDFDSTNLTKDRVKLTIKKLEDYRDSTRKLETEDIQISNFLSYLYFLLEDYEHAHQYIDESLQNDPDNIIANANRLRILLETGKISKVEDAIAKLQKLEGREDCNKRKCYAEADLAYAYGWSGPRYHQKAVDLYTRVLEAYPSEYAWQYGLGLILSRKPPWLISHDRFNPRENENATVRAAELFLTVATESNHPNLRANAFARLGKAVYSISKKQYTKVPDEIMRLKPKEYFEKAAEICPEEPSVLDTCGQFARYRGDLDSSEKLLRKSLQIKPSRHAYHHLALTLKRRVDLSRSDAHNKGAYNFSLGANGNRRGGRYNSGYGQKGRHSFQGGYGPHGSSRKRDSQNENCQQKGPSRECMSDQSEWTRRNLRQMIKSPLNVRVYPGNKHLSEAIELIEKAQELSEYDLNIQNDKGIIYRMLGQTEKAVEVFKNIVNKKKYYPTKYLVTNVYEQLGLCLLELSKSVDISPDIQQKYKKDGQAHLSYAVQLQMETVANDPQFKEAWNSYPSLRELFSDERDGKPRQLAVLHMLMGDHRDSIDIYRKLSLEENDKMEPEDCVNMLKCYQKEGQFEECVFLLKSWECTTKFSGLPPSLIFDVYIDCAFHAYTTDNAQLAYQHFKRAFRVYDMFDKIDGDAINVDKERATKDILILHSCSRDSECKIPRNLGTILEDVTGLRYTLNSDDVLPNKLVLPSVDYFIQQIPCIIIMTHESADSYHPLLVDQAIQRSSEKSGPQVLVVSDDKRNTPDIARTKPFIRMPPPLEGAMDPNGQIPEEHQEWMKEFFTLLKPK